jgi:hypothetical protein
MVNVFLMKEIYDRLSTTTDTEPTRIMRNRARIGKLVPNTFKMGIIRAYQVGTLSNISNGLLKLEDARAIALRKPFLQVFSFGFSVVDVHYTG